MTNTIPESSTKVDKDNPFLVTKWYTTRPIFPAHSNFPALIRTTDPKIYLRPMHKDDLQAFHELRQQWEVMKYTSKQDIDKTLDETQTWLARFIAADKKPPETQAQSNPDKNASTSTAMTESETIIKDELKRPIQPNFGFSIIYSESSEPPLSSGKVIGTGGFHTIDPEPELGYMIRQEYWGRGIVSVSMKALLATYWSLPRRIIEIDPDHQMATWSVKPEIITRQQEPTPKVFVMEHLNAQIEPSNLGSVRVCEKLGLKYVGDHLILEKGDVVKLAVHSAQRDLRRNVVSLDI